MLLYHFTRAGAINDILKNGILPGKGSSDQLAATAQ